MQPGCHPCEPANDVDSLWRTAKSQRLAAGLAWHDLSQSSRPWTQWAGEAPPHCPKASLALENLALPTNVYRRTASRPKLQTTDRLIWVWLPRVWAGWRQPLVIVTPDTILRWQRRRFRAH